MSANCVIYCTGDINLEDLKLSIENLINGTKITSTYFKTTFYEISIHKNDEFDPSKQIHFPDGFLFFKFLIDIEFEPTVVLKDRAFEISKLLHWFWSSKMPAVASCDFEDLLTNNGGYKSTTIPWPGK